MTQPASRFPNGGERARYGIAVGSIVLPSRYRSARLLAVGGMGEVYLATDTAARARRSRSRCFPSATPTTRRFDAVQARGARGGAPVRAAQCVTVYDVGEHEGTAVHRDGYMEGVRSRRAVWPVASSSHERSTGWDRRPSALDAAHRRGSCTGTSSRPTCCSTAAGACRCRLRHRLGCRSRRAHASRHRARNGRLSVPGAGRGEPAASPATAMRWASSRSSCSPAAGRSRPTRR